jgi:hypothetical protein
LRNNDGFVAGMVAGLAVGAVIAMAMTPSVRRPVMQGASQLGGRMRKMMNRGRGEQVMEAVEEMLPGDMA